MLSYLTLLLKRIGSCGMIDTWLLSRSIFTSDTSIPSIVILPPDSSTSLKRATIIELFPDPVRPTIPERLFKICSLSIDQLVEALAHHWLNFLIDNSTLNALPRKTFNAYLFSRWPRYETKFYSTPLANLVCIWALHRWIQLHRREANSRESSSTTSFRRLRSSMSIIIMPIIIIM